MSAHHVQVLYEVSRSPSGVYTHIGLNFGYFSQQEQLRPWDVGKKFTIRIYKHEDSLYIWIICKYLDSLYM